MKRKNTLMCLTLIVISLLQFGCGFRLRGMVNIAPEYLPIAIAADGVYIQITPVLTQTLQGAGLPVVDVAQAKSVLRLRSEHYEKQLLTVATSGESQTHSIKYTVSFMIMRVANDNATLPPDASNLINDNSNNTDVQTGVEKTSSKPDEKNLNQVVSVTRSFQFEKKAVLSSAAEETIIKKEMLTDAAQQILRRLNHLKANSVISKNLDTTVKNTPESSAITPDDMPKPLP